MFQPKPVNLPFPKTGKMKRVATKPSNQDTLLRTKSYEAELPVLLATKIEKAREFYLKELVPLVIALQTGLQDGHDTLKAVVGEDPDSTPYFRVAQQLLSDAVIAKTAHFIGDYAALSPAEWQHYLTLQFQNKEGKADVSDIIKSILHEMREVPSVPGQKEKPEGSQVPGIQANQSGPRSGPRGARPRSRNRSQ